MNITGATAVSRRHVLATLKKPASWRLWNLQTERGGLQWDSCVLALAAHRGRAAGLRKQNFAWSPLHRTSLESCLYIYTVQLVRFGKRQPF
jgi:hypothetical protein